MAFYTPIALVLGLSLGFLHAHAVWPRAGAIAEAWFFTFFFIAVPEELFFRGWVQNLLERRMGPIPCPFRHRGALRLGPLQQADYKL